MIVVDTIGFGDAVFSYYDICHGQSATNIEICLGLVSRWACGWLVVVVNDAAEWLWIHWEIDDIYPLAFWDHMCDATWLWVKTLVPWWTSHSWASLCWMWTNSNIVARWYWSIPLLQETLLVVGSTIYRCLLSRKQSQLLLGASHERSRSPINIAMVNHYGGW